MTKRELRKIYLARQKFLSCEKQAEKSLKIAARFFHEFALADVQFLHVFLAIEKRREIKSDLIIARLWRDFPKAKTIVPRVDFETMTLENFEYNSDTKLVRNKWNILEPTDAKFVDNKKIDLVLVPLLAFDERGFRVGYGRGFYDKFLSKCRRDVVKIGLSYFAPVAEISDIKEFDVKLDFCITLEKIWKF